MDADKERTTCRDRIRDYDSRLVQKRAELKRAQTQNTGAKLVNEAAARTYQELLDHRGSLADGSATIPLASDIERLAQDQQIAVCNVQKAAESLEQCQTRIAELERVRFSLQIDLNWLTEQYSQIEKQIEK